MGSEAIENDWFTASFPSHVEVKHDDSDRLAKVVEYTAELEPFGIFSIRVTNMAIDLFIAVGASKWVSDFGDSLVKLFADRKVQRGLCGSRRRQAVTPRGGEIGRRARSLVAALGAAVALGADRGNSSVTWPWPQCAANVGPLLTRFSRKR